MFSHFTALVPIAALATLGLAFLMLPRRIKLGLLSAAFLTALLSGITQPALATPGGSDIVSEGRQPVSGTADTSPQASQYQGFEFPETKGTPLSDREITNRIRQNVSDDLKLSVSNGSVRISGSVSNRQVAQEIVKDIKDIPGVHEISYDLGLNG